MAKEVSRVFAWEARVPRGRGIFQAPRESLVTGLRLRVWLGFGNENKGWKGPLVMPGFCLGESRDLHEFRMQELRGFGVILAVMTSFQIVFFCILSV